jgi:hypothetical protein
MRASKSSAEVAVVSASRKRSRLASARSWSMPGDGEVALAAGLLGPLDRAVERGQDALAVRPLVAEVGTRLVGPQRQQRGRAGRQHLAVVGFDGRALAGGGGETEDGDERQERTTGRGVEHAARLPTALARSSETGGSPARRAYDRGDEPELALLEGQRAAGPVSPLLLALLAALLFGASTPASKLLLGTLPPLHLAGLLYLGAAAGMLPVALRDRRRRPRKPIDRRNLGRLAGSVVFGGIVGPVLVLLALRRSTSGSVALLLNLEIVATAVLGVALFREHLGRLGWGGVAGGLAAGALISAGSGWPGLRAGLLVAGACLAWGLDNHFTALIDALGPAEAAVWKGLWPAGRTSPSAGARAGSPGAGGRPRGARRRRLLVRAQHRALRRRGPAPGRDARAGGLRERALPRRRALLRAARRAARLGASRRRDPARGRRRPARARSATSMPTCIPSSSTCTAIGTTTATTCTCIPAWRRRCATRTCIRHEPLAHAHRHLPDLHHRHAHRG